MQKIEIQGGVVRLVTTSVEREMLLEDFKSLLFETKSFSTPRLPVRCAFVIGATEGINRVAYVVERPPTMAHMTLIAKDMGYYEERDEDNDDYEDQGIRYPTEEYDVAVPWQYWIIITDPKPVGEGRPGRIPTWPVRGIMYVWSQTQVESIEEVALSQAWVPNTNGPTHFCMGRTDFDADTLDGLIDSIVDTWWHVPFNTDLGRNIPYEFTSLKEWQESEREPRIDPGTALYSLRQLVESSTGYTYDPEPAGLSHNHPNGKKQLASVNDFAAWVHDIDPYWLATIAAHVENAMKRRLEEITEVNNRRLLEEARAREARAIELQERRRLARVAREQAHIAANPPTEDPSLADLLR